jgi:prepilin-type N-terminal cleavage/methylation domain-containing protein
LEENIMLERLKKTGFSLIEIMCVIAIIGVLAAGAAIAGSVYDREIVTLGTTTGTQTWTNDFDYAAIQLKKISFYSSADAAATLTVSRVTSDSTYTQSVCTIVGAGADSNATSFTTSYLKPSDELVCESSTATSGAVMVEFEVQKH